LALATRKARDRHSVVSEGPRWVEQKTVCNS
jgi:hypothetical protein